MPPFLIAFVGLAAGAWYAYRWLKAEALRAEEIRAEAARADGEIRPLVRDPATGVFRPGA